MIKKILIIILSIVVISLFVFLGMQYNKTNTQLYDANKKITDIKKDLNESNNKIDEYKDKLKKANKTIEDLKSDEYEFVYLGEYKITYYCDERYDHICGGSGVTASGKPTKVGSTIGVNPKEIPYGSTVYIEGLGFRSADDTGSGIGTKHIDVLVSTHEEALSQTLLKGGVWLLVKK